MTEKGTGATPGLITNGADKDLGWLKNEWEISQNECTKLDDSVATNYPYIDVECDEKDDPDSRSC